MNQRTEAAATLGAGDASDVVFLGEAPAEARAAAYFDPLAASHYEVRGEVARGGMGRILEAWDRRFQRPVALKVLLRADALSLRRFAREASLTARLEHPAIVPMHEAGRLASGEPFYAMKLVRGRSLGEACDEATGAEARLALLPHLIALADALSYAHDRGIVHRDVKPSNVLLGDFGETVVIDWGLAKDLAASDLDEPVALQSGETLATPDEAREPLTLDGTTLGTPSYMPPEQASGGHVDERADVYALGAVLYHVLSGRPPYRSASADAVVAAPPTPIAAVAPVLAPDLIAIVTKAMARDPAARYPSAREVADDLRRFTTGQLVSAHRYSVSSLVQRWARKHRRALAAAGAFVVALAVLGAVAVRRVVRERDRADAAKVTADAARETAEAHRQAAEALVDFVLGTLRERLEPLGKLDLMAGVGGEVDQYYRRIGASAEALDAPTLNRRAAALEALAGVEGKKRNADGAVPLWTTASLWRERALAISDREDAPLAALVEDELSLAQLECDRGKLDDAKAHVDRAREMYVAHAGPSPNVARRLLAVQVDKMEAGVASSRGKVDESIALLRRAIEGDRAILAADPESELGTRLLAGLDFNAAVELNRERAYADAEPLLDEGVAINRRALAQKPDDADRRRRMGWMYSLAGNAAVGLRKLDRAADFHRSALALRRQLTGVEPANEEWRREEADSDNQLSDVELQQGHTTEALAHARAAVTLVDAAWKRANGGGNTPEDLASVTATLIEAELASGRFAEARDLSARGIDFMDRAIGEHKDEWRVTAAIDFRLTLVRAELGLGAVERAREAYAKAAAMLPDLTDSEAFKDQEPLAASNVGAAVALAAGDLEEATRELARAFEKSALLGDRIDMKQRLDLALAALETARALRPRAADRARDLDARAHALMSADLDANRLTDSERARLRRAGATWVREAPRSSPR